MELQKAGTTKIKALLTPSVCCMYVELKKFNAKIHVTNSAGSEKTFPTVTPPEFYKSFNNMLPNIILTEYGKWFTTMACV